MKCVSVFFSFVLACLFSHLETDKLVCLFYAIYIFSKFISNITTVFPYLLKTPGTLFLGPFMEPC